MKLKSLAIALVIVISACKKEEDSKPNQPTLPSVIKQGTWRITLYNDGGTDETNYFAGYSFTFNADGSVSAINNSQTVNGNWSAKVDDGKNKLVLNLGTKSPFEELNDDWRILEQTSSKIRLDDVSGGSGEVDLLTFEKN